MVRIMRGMRLLVLFRRSGALISIPGALISKAEEVFAFDGSGSLALCGSGVAACSWEISGVAT